MYPFRLAHFALLPSFLQAIQPRSFAVSATEDVANVSPCEMESIINQLMNPSPEYQLHVSHLLQHCIYP